MKTGDKVICVRSVDEPQRVGKKAIVKGLYACKCGSLKIDVGDELPKGFYGTICSICSHDSPFGIMWWDANCWRKLEQYSLTVNEYREESVEIEEAI